MTTVVTYPWQCDDKDCQSQWHFAAVELAERIGDWYVALWDNVLAEVGDYVDVIQMEGDLGQQNGPMFSPKLFSARSHASATGRYSSRTELLANIIASVLSFSARFLKFSNSAAFRRNLSCHSATSSLAAFRSACSCACGSKGGATDSTLVSFSEPESGFVPSALEGC